ncbi:hypothetical protein GF366_00195, partial [Candidatus Peregrinibacteria bacterium]|nr:hypothetical protein [Candidatus Peregrinibacteria bacterium]
MLNLILMREGNLNILLGGPAGAGIEKSGKTLTLSFVRAGYFVFANVEHMSQIRHGNNFLRLRIDEKSHESHVEEIDVMVALDKTTIEEHLNEMNEGGVIIFDNEVVNLEKGFDSGKATLVGVPLKKLAKEKLENPVMANVISLGIICRIADFDVEILKKVLGKVFAKKGEEIISLNEKAADLGFELGEKWAEKFPVKMPAKKAEPHMFLMGN